VCSKRFTQRNHANHSDARARYAVLKERAETQLSRGGMDTWPRSAGSGLDGGTRMHCPRSDTRRDRSFKTEQ
jgi:hypothetical protein